MDTDRTVVESFIANHPFSAAQVLEGLKEEEVAEFIRELPNEKSLQLLGLMNINKAAKCFTLLPAPLAKEMMESSDVAFAEALCRQFDEHYRNNLLAGLSPDLSATLSQKLEQFANTVGVFMVPAIGVNREMLVKDALEIIKGNKENLEPNLYVVNVQGMLEGAVRLEELLFAERNMALSELMITDIPRFFHDTPIKNVVDHSAWYEYRFIPVTDRSEKLLGSLPFSTTKKATSEKSGQLTKEILDTGTALGELYLIGLTSFLQSVGK